MIEAREREDALMTKCSRVYNRREDFLSSCSISVLTGRFGFLMKRSGAGHLRYKAVGPAFITCTTWWQHCTDSEGVVSLKVF